MTTIMRQQLATVVAGLNEHIDKAINIIRQLEVADLDEADLESLRTQLRAEQLHLVNRQTDLETELKEWNNYMRLLNEQQRTEAEGILAAFPVNRNDLAEGNEGVWPLYKLFNHARELLNRITVYFSAAQSNAESEHVNSRQGNIRARAHGISPRQQDDNFLDDLNDSVHSLLHVSGGNSQNNPHGHQQNAIFGNQHRSAFQPIQQRQSTPAPNPPLGTAHVLHHPRAQAAHQAQHHQQPNFSQPLGAPPPATPVYSFLKPARLEPPKFTGDPREWPAFWAFFNRAVHTQPIPPIEKHLILLQHLQEKSAARRAIEGYAINDTSYNIVIGILTERFGSQKMLIKKLQAQLLQLQAAGNSLQSLRTFYEDVERICLQLGPAGNGLGDELLCNIIKGKLPADVHLKLKEMEDNSYITWSNNELRAALGKIITDREEVEACIQTFKGPEKPKQHDHGRSSHRDQQHGQRPQYHQQQSGAQPAQHMHSFQVSTDQPAQHVCSQCQPDPAPPSNTFQASTGQPNQQHQRVCSLCDKPDHAPSNCTTYKTPKERKARLVEQSRCFRCLRQGHQAKECQSTRQCRYCKADDHHFIICDKKPTGQRRGPPSPGTVTFQPKTGGNAEPVNPEGQHANHMAIFTSPAPPPTEQLDAEPLSQPVSAMAAFTKRPALPTIEEEKEDIEQHTILPIHRKKKCQFLMSRTLQVSSRRNPSIKVNVLVFMDPGSDVSYISKRLVQQLLPAKLQDQWLYVHTFATKTARHIHSPTYSITIRRQDGQWEELELNVVDEIGTQMIAYEYEDQQQFSETATELSAPIITTHRTKPDILIGSQFWDFFISRTPSRDGYHLVNTVFGTVLGGGVDLPPPPPQPAPTMTFMAVGESNLESMPPIKAVEEFWAIETIGITDDPRSKDDEVAMQLFKDSIRQLDSGQYSVRWPWRDPRPQLRSNWQMAYSRLKSLVNRMQMVPILQKEVPAIIADQESKGIIEPAGRQEDELFLPYHAVISPKKVRLVVDASASTRSHPSLNSCMYRGPVILPDLAGLLIRFRCSAYPIWADVQAAFHAIFLEPEERRFCKIMVLKDWTKPISSQNLDYKQYTKVVFGATASPFLLAGVLLHHFAKYDTPLARKMESNTYVDNLLLENDDIDTAIKEAAEAKQIFKEAVMNLREFLSHVPAIMQQFPEADRLEKALPKTLGITWVTQEDAIRFDFPSPTQGQLTRRSVLSSYSSIYDPLGLIGPCVLPAKAFFQAQWEDEVTWDDPISEERRNTWLHITEPWEGASITVPRHSILIGWTDLQLHVFCDASSNTFATAIYIRSEASSGINSNLIFSKNRLKPRKAANTYTIPRLELLGILIGVRAKQFITKQLHRPISAVHIWSDSTIALSWIKSNEHKQAFEQRRVDEIRQKADATFHFVRTHENPADICTRGATPAELQDSKLWWHGPEWIISPPADWPVETDLNFEIGMEDDCQPTPSSQELDTQTFTAQTDDRDLLFNVNRFGTMHKLLRTAIRVFAFLGKLRRQNIQLGDIVIDPASPFKAECFRAARLFLIIRDQRHYLPDNPKGNRQHFTLLSPEGLLCIKTRVAYHKGPDQLGHPILLHRQSPLTRLIIEEIHHDLFHSGVDATVTEFLRRYWIPQARRTVRQIVTKCLKCRRMNSPPFERPLMPPLPAIRVKPARPFAYIGIDYFGPRDIRQQGMVTKSWVVIITCLVTRGIYLEATLDMSAPSFINVLRRFISRRGRPLRIISDNALTFTSTSKALDVLTGPPPETSPEQFANAKGIHWHFIPALSPWAGATYERLIQIIKRCIQRTIGRRILEYDDFQAFLAECEAIANARPISWVSDRPDGPLPLTPIDLIQHSGPIDLENVPEYLDIDSDDLSKPEQLAALWKAHREASDHFWLRWSTDYLITIRDKAGWIHKGPHRQTSGHPKVGDIVLIEEDLKPRTFWPMGRVIALNGTPPDIRSVQLQVGKNIWTRTVSRLCPLEAHLGEEAEEATVAPNNNSDEQPTLIADLPSMAAPENHPIPPNSQLAAIHSSVQPVHSSQTPAEPPATTGHKMITRHKGRMLGLNTMTIITLIAILSCFMPAATAIFAFLNPQSASTSIPCGECQLLCNNRGVLARMPSTVQKAAICCQGHCLDRPGAAEFDFQLPYDLLLNDYKCAATYWTDSDNSFTAETHCSAVNECQLLDCTFCLEQLTAPQCNPRLAIAVTCTLFTFIGAIFCCFYSCLHSVKSLTRASCKLLALLLSGPCRFIFWLSGRRWTAIDSQNVANRLENGANTLSRKMRERANQMLPRMRGRRARNIARQIFGGIAITLIFMSAGSLGTHIAVNTKTEVCRRGQHGLICTIDYATTLTLLPAGQTTSLIFSDTQGVTLGAFSIQSPALHMACNPKTEGFFRSYTVKVLAAKRCPRAAGSSCFDDYCSNVRPSSQIAELKEVNNLPGNSFCRDSSSFWSHGCALPVAACLFYRYYASPTSREIFEAFTCNMWETHITATLLMEMVDGKRDQKTVTLHPGISTNWGNITITPIAISLPPAPVLGGHFITNGRSVAVTNKLPPDLSCATEQAARALNCTLSINACRECFPNHTSGAVECHCRDLDLDSLIDDANARLPRPFGKLRLTSQGPAVQAEFLFAPIQLHISLKGQQLVAQFTDSLCTITPGELHGCYRCSTGAQFNFNCRSDHESPLAAITCQDGTTFTAHCNTQGHPNTQILQFNTSLINKNCTTSCPAGDTHFVLGGNLIYIPLHHQFQAIAREAETTNNPSNLHSLWPSLPMLGGYDPFALWRLLAFGPYLIAALCALLTGLVLAFIVCKAMLLRRTFGLFMRAVGLWTVPAAAALPTISPLGQWVPRHSTWENVSQLLLRPLAITITAAICTLFICIGLAFAIAAFFHRRRGRARRALGNTLPLALIGSRATACPALQATTQLQHSPPSAIHFQPEPTGYFNFSPTDSLGPTFSTFCAHFTHHGPFQLKTVEMDRNPRLQASSGRVNTSSGQPLNGMPITTAFMARQDIRAGSAIYITNTPVPGVVIVEPPPAIDWHRYIDALPANPLQQPVADLISREEFNRPWQGGRQANRQQQGHSPPRRGNRQQQDNNPPRRGVPAPWFLQDRLGANWQWNRRQEAETILRDNRLYHRGRREIITFDGLSTGNANGTFVTPSTTVNAFWCNTLRHPELPLLIQLGGERGTGRIGRRAKAAGRAVWRDGERHQDYIPLEHVNVIESGQSPEPPPPGVDDNQAERSPSPRPTTSRHRGPIPPLYSIFVIALMAAILPSSTLAFAALTGASPALTLPLLGANTSPIALHTTAPPIAAPPIGALALSTTTLAQGKRANSPPPFATFAIPSVQNSANSCAYCSNSICFNPNFIMASKKVQDDAVSIGSNSSPSPAPKLRSVVNVVVDHQPSRHQSRSLRRSPRPSSHRSRSPIERFVNRPYYPPPRRTLGTMAARRRDDKEQKLQATTQLQQPQELAKTITKPEASTIKQTPLEGGWWKIESEPPYFYHKPTKTSQWHPPKDFNASPLASSPAAPSSSAASSAPPSSSPSAFPALTNGLALTKKIVAQHVMALELIGTNPGLATQLAALHKSIVDVQLAIGGGPGTVAADKGK